jgi:hypothetical protein
MYNERKDYLLAALKGTGRRDDNSERPNGNPQYSKGVGRHNFEPVGYFARD